MKTSLYFDTIPVCISKRVIKNQQTPVKHSKREPTKYQGSRPSDSREFVYVLWC